MLILFRNILSWVIAENGQSLARHGLLLGFITVLLVAVAMIGGFFLAYLGTMGMEALGGA